MKTRFTNRLLSISSGSSPYDFEADYSIYEKYNIDKSRIIIDVAKIEGMDTDTDYFVIDNESSSAINSTTLSFIADDETKEPVLLNTFSAVQSREKKNFEVCGNILNNSYYLILSMDTPPEADFFIESVRKQNDELIIKVVDNY